MNTFRIECTMDNVYEVFMQLNLALSCKGMFWINDKILANIIHVGMEVTIVEDTYIPTCFISVIGQLADMDTTGMERGYA